jgi:plasmid stability protein
MATLYLRNVPDEVGERLATLAAREGMSVSSFAVRELADVARRAANPALLRDLPDLGITSVEVVAGLEEARASR